MTDGKKLTRHEWMTARAGVLDLLYLCSTVGLRPNEQQFARIKAAWDLVKDPAEPSLKIFEKKESPILLPSSAAHVPRVKVPGMAGWSGT